MTVGLAIVGCGAVTRIAHVPVLGMLGDLVRVVAVCDPDQRRADEVAGLVGGAKAYTRLDQVLDDPDVHAADICTPHALHADLAVQALEAGRHVLVEKPLATTFADGQRMVSAALQAGRVLAVNEQIRFGAGVRAARALIEQGAIGDLVSVRAHRLFELPPPYAASGWRNDPSDPSAGILIDQGPHYVHMLRRMAGAVAGEITQASAVAASARRRPRSSTCASSRVCWANCCSRGTRQRRRRQRLATPSARSGAWRSIDATRHWWSTMRAAKRAAITRARATWTR